jgi:hypothetical protein
MPAEKKRIFTALYDLDAFRNSPVYRGSALATTTESQSMTGDLDLLLAAMDWVRENILTDSPKKA